VGGAGGGPWVCGACGDEEGGGGGGRVFIRRERRPPPPPPPPPPSFEHLPRQVHSGRGRVGLGQIHERPHGVTVDRQALKAHALKDREPVTRARLAIPEVRTSVKRDLFIWQKSPVHILPLSLPLSLSLLLSLSLSPSRSRSRSLSLPLSLSLSLSLLPSRLGEEVEECVVCGSVGLDREGRHPLQDPKAILRSAQVSKETYISGKRALPTLAYLRSAQM